MWSKLFEKKKPHLLVGLPTPLDWEPPMSNGVYSGIDVDRMMRKIVPGARGATQCPECHDAGPLFTVIVHLNDEHRWTRDKIADWTDTLPLDLTMHVARKQAHFPDQPRRIQYVLPVAKSVTFQNKDAFPTVDLNYEVEYHSGLVMTCSCGFTTSPLHTIDHQQDILNKHIYSEESNV